MKRNDFLARLIELSQLNEQFLALRDVPLINCRQPSYTKRIKAIQMAQCQINLPQKYQAQSENKYNQKILVLSKHKKVDTNLRYKTTTNNQGERDNIKTEYTEQQRQELRKKNTTTRGTTKQTNQFNDQVLMQNISLAKIRPHISEGITPIQSEAIKSNKTEGVKSNKTEVIKSHVLQGITSIVPASNINYLSNMPNSDAIYIKQQSISRRKLKINQYKNYYKSSSIKRYSTGASSHSINVLENAEEVLSPLTPSISIHSNNAIHYNNSTNNATNNTIQSLNRVMKNNQHANEKIIENRYRHSVNQMSYLSRQKQVEEERKAKILLRKEIHKNYAKPFMPPPKITASSYIILQIFEGNNIPNKVVVSFNSKNSVEVASLTKIMTCILIIEICYKYHFNLKDQTFTIGKYQSNIAGTTASLKKGQIYTIQQLLYGLMLPSGNDASVALAVWGGKTILNLKTEIQSEREICINKETDSPKRLINNLNLNFIPSSSQKYTKQACYNKFLQEMNEKAKDLKMLKTKYANSHGLANSSNRSSAFDIAVLCEYAMKNEIFRNIVSCRQYESTIKMFEVKEELIQNSSMTNEQNLSSPEKYEPISATRKTTFRQNNQNNNENCLKRMPIKWQNTHKLLVTKPQEYIGIKTGMTTSAGPCLSSCITASNRKFIIVVLGCAKVHLRFRETEVLKKWLYKQEGLEGLIRKFKKIIDIKLDDNEDEKEKQDEEDDNLSQKYIGAEDNDHDD